MPKRRANGEGSIYQRKDGKWCAQYIDCLGKKRYLYGKTQQAVRKKLQEAIRQNDAGISLEPKRITFSAWVKEWLDVYQKPVLKESTYVGNLVHWRVHIEPYFNKIQLKDIRAEQIQRFVNEKSEKRRDGKPGGYSPSMVQLIYGLITGSLKKAVSLGYIPRNPAEGINVKPREHKDKRIFSVEEQRRFEKYIREDMERHPDSSIFLLLLYTGMRIGEALGLQISDIDFKEREIHINRTVGTITKESGYGSQFYVSTPKTKAGKRVIPMSDTVMELLAGQELSSGQLYERLGRRFTQPTAAAVVAEMMERQYVDDERYARTRAHGLLVARKSRRAAAQDLRQKGLDAQQISAALEEVYAPDEAGGDPELEAAAALVEGRYRGKLAAGRKDLVVAALARRGFAYPVIKEAIRRVEEDG